MTFFPVPLPRMLGVAAATLLATLLPHAGCLAFAGTLFFGVGELLAHPASIPLLTAHAQALGMTPWHYLSQLCTSSHP